MDDSLLGRLVAFRAIVFSDSTGRGRLSLVWHAFGRHADASPCGFLPRLCRSKRISVQRLRVSNPGSTWIPLFWSTHRSSHPAVSSRFHRAGSASRSGGHQRAVLHPFFAGRDYPAKTVGRTAAGFSVYWMRAFSGSCTTQTFSCHG